MWEGDTRDEREATVERTEWTVSEWIDTKTHQRPEEEHDRHLRRTRELIGGERKGRKEGPDRLRYRAGKKGGGGNCILYADDTSATQT